LREEELNRTEKEKGKGNLKDKGKKTPSVTKGKKGETARGNL